MDVANIQIGGGMTGAGELRSSPKLRKRRGSDGKAQAEGGCSTYRPNNLSLHSGINAGRLGDRRNLLLQFDRMRRQIDGSGMMAGMDQFHPQAFQLLVSPEVAGAFELERESGELRDRYGRTLWGQSCLLARRLAEAGVGVISIDALAPKAGMPKYFSWDDHANAQPGWDLAEGMRLRAADKDPALSTLIDDIYARGLSDQIAVVAMGEFGRTPRLVHSNGCWGRGPLASSPVRARVRRRLANGTSHRSDQFEGGIPRPATDNSPGPPRHHVSAFGNQPPRHATRLCRPSDADSPVGAGYS